MGYTVNVWDLNLVIPAPSEDFAINKSYGPFTNMD